MGGPAEPNVTNWIQARANGYLGIKFDQIKRMPVEKATTIKPYNYIQPYVDDLAYVIDMAAIKDANISIGVDPLGGASVHYWQAIKDKYGINMTVTNEVVDPTFRFYDSRFRWADQDGPLFTLCDGEIDRPKG